MRRREQHREGPALRLAHDRRPLASGGIHDRADVVHALLEGRRPGDTVGHAHAALVEEDQPRELREALAPAAVLRELPHDLQVGVRTLDVHEVDRAVTHDPVGDVHAGAPRKADLGHGHRFPWIQPPRNRAPAIGGRAASTTSRGSLVSCASVGKRAERADPAAGRGRGRRRGTRRSMVCAQRARDVGRRDRGRRRRGPACILDRWQRSPSEAGTASRGRVPVVLAAARPRSSSGSPASSARTRRGTSTTRTSSNCGGTRRSEGRSDRVG